MCMEFLNKKCIIRNYGASGDIIRKLEAKL